MRRHLERLPIHRKLVALALVVSTAGLLVALVGLVLVDVWRFSERAEEDAASLAGILAETSAAAVAFEDEDAAREILSAVRVRSEITRVCVYLADGRPLASYGRAPDVTCPRSLPETDGFLYAGASHPIARNGRIWGTVYVERDFSGLAERVGVASAAALAMLLLGSALSLALAQRLTHSISDPIVQLAAEARRVGREEEISVPEIPDSADEVGDLVRAFKSMLVRIRHDSEGLQREIEERKRMEAEREALLERERETSRLKDEFVATVSHELRTPLSVVLSWAQILETTGADEGILARALPAISRSASQQARIIDDLVDISRVVTGKLQLHVEVLDLRETVESSVDEARTDAAAKGVRIGLELPDRACIVRGDPDRIRQMIGNLLSNAVKFTDGAGTVSVTLVRGSSEHALEIADEGVGIPPEVLPYVFDRYRQGDSSTRRRHGGLGLGLAIVKELAEQHGGAITLESEGPGRGATARLRLPAAAESRAVPIAATAPTGEPRIDGVAVLAIDDNEEALEGMATALATRGAVVHTASSGKAALERWEQLSPHVVLCDLAMPGMDGFTVLERIRALDARSGRQTVVIAVTAHATSEHRRRSLEAGFREHVSKPYRIADLVRTIRSATSVGIR